MSDLRENSTPLTNVETAANLGIEEPIPLKKSPQDTSESSFLALKDCVLFYESPIGAMVAGRVVDALPLVSPYYFPDFTDQAQMRIDPLLRRYQLDPDTVWKLWEDGLAVSGPSFMRGKRLEHTVLKMKYLESLRQGIIKVLFDEFGIINLSRYPAELLIKQYDERNKQMPYAAQFIAKTDSNGAFSRPQGLSHLTTELGDTYAYRIIECASVQEILKAHKMLNDRYGNHYKIGGAIFSGHGTPLTINYGQNKVEMWQSDSNSVRLIAKMYVESPEIVFESCSTGIEGGIAEAFSRRGVTIHAPSVDTIANDLHASIDEQNRVHWQFMIVKGDGEGIDTNVYKDGVIQRRYHP